MYTKNGLCVVFRLANSISLARSIQPFNMEEGWTVSPHCSKLFCLLVRTRLLSLIVSVVKFRVPRVKGNFLFLIW
ncbi:hypothetical protein SPOG_05398 [Schizosaccharomyces cryophilus OY26]|uniref:Uncharacterized protein n=1 Tax=Schizosaccharomyces cryophilus (strain OY26 / ATCC MYA-4695 / CBS 11777 / NBRC 106824 / NRRL Y48691) TaxID=653667 RepID=S9W5S2_SCHCR|nr:uncharacterized protein SPOG_05398 [Schizosaccharomyces cryophilus OY26]EPY53894.1 hypothetical protein SPOG_05398 [Schizosaccharomyces cryophilus OY26]